MSPGGRVPCPTCKELVHPDATVCPFCRQTILNRDTLVNAVQKVVLGVALFILFYFLIGAWVDYEAQRETDEIQRRVQELVR